MMNVGGVYATISADISPLQQGLQRASAALGGVEARFDRTGVSADAMARRVGTTGRAMDQSAASADRLRFALTGVNGVLATLGVGFSAAALLHGLESANAALDGIITSERRMEGASRLAGLGLSDLVRVAREAQEAFLLTEAQANDYATQVGRATERTKDFALAQQGLAATMQIAAREGIPAERALNAYRQALIGVDEGTDLLLGKNPSELFDATADSAERAAAINQALIEKASALGGAFHESLTDVQRAQAEVNIALEQAQKAFAAAYAPARLRLIQGQASALNGLAGALENSAGAMEAMGRGATYGALAGVAVSIGKITVARAQHTVAALREAQAVATATTAALADARASAAQAAARVAVARASMESARQMAAETANAAYARNARLELTAALQAQRAAQAQVVAITAAETAALTRASVAATAAAAAKGALARSVAFLTSPMGVAITTAGLLAAAFYDSGRAAREAARDVDQYRTELAGLSEEQVRVRKAQAEQDLFEARRDLARLEPQKRQVPATQQFGLSGMRTILPEGYEEAQRAVTRATAELAAAEEAMERFGETAERALTPPPSTLDELGKRAKTLVSLLDSLSARGESTAGVQAQLAEIRAEAERIAAAETDVFSNTRAQALALAADLRALGETRFLQGLRDRAGTLTTIFDSLRDRGEDVSSVVAEIYRLNTRVEGVIRSQGGAMTEVRAEALQLADALRDALHPSLKLDTEDFRRAIEDVTKEAQDLLRERLKFDFGPGIARSVHGGVVLNQRDNASDLLLARARQNAQAIDPRGTLRQAPTAEADDWARAATDAARGLVDLGDAAGILGDDARRALGGVTGLAAGIQNFQGAPGILGKIGAGLGIAGAVAGIASSLFGGGESPRERERNQILERNNERLRELSLALSGFATTLGDRRLAGEAARGILANPELLYASMLGPEGDRNLLAKLLEPFGLSVDQFAKIAKDAGVDIFDSTGNLVIPALKQFADAAQQSADALIGFRNTMADQRSALAAYQEIFDITDPTKLLEGQVGLLEQFAPELLRQFGLANLNLDSTAGRNVLEQGLRDIFEAYRTGALDKTLLEGFESGEQFVEALLAADRALDAFGETAQAVTSSMSNVPTVLNAALLKYNASVVGVGGAPPGTSPRDPSRDPWGGSDPRVAPGTGGVAARSIVVEGDVNIYGVQDVDALTDEVEERVVRRAASGPTRTARVLGRRY